MPPRRVAPIYVAVANQSRTPVDVKPAIAPAATPPISVLSRVSGVGQPPKSSAANFVKTLVPDKECAASALVPFYIPIQTPTFDNCKRSYEIAKRLGAGYYGTVYAACKTDGLDRKHGKQPQKEQECGFVMKVVGLQNESRIGTADREHYFSCKLNDTNLSVLYFGGWRCGGNAFLIFEQMESDLLELARIQAIEMGMPPNSVLFTQEQIDQMYRLTKELSKKHVVHGDLQLVNILQKGKGRDIRLSDFGRAGDFITFLPGKLINKQNAEGVLTQKVDQAWLMYHDSWNLEKDLLQHKAFIQATNGKVAPFTGFGNQTIPADIRKLIDEVYLYSRGTR